ncbi:hypothetical protein CYMTET_49434 [Cymbomonas tetramitiformis]|uniref:Uncharacterized protein n=1 Tax=Cymbomonas tetramitiformis TaxID=36881 RepID=A0AAE0BQ36_9CHLO|nr:hypothetical protein CYMTET_49434 [Cymbomonas tetramitiformis]
MAREKPYKDRPVDGRYQPMGPIILDRRPQGQEFLEKLIAEEQEETQKSSSPNLPTHDRFIAAFFRYDKFIIQLKGYQMCNISKEDVSEHPLVQAASNIHFLEALSKLQVKIGLAAPKYFPYTSATQETVRKECVQHLKTVQSFLKEFMESGRDIHLDMWTLTGELAKTGRPRERKKHYFHFENIAFETYFQSGSSAEAVNLAETECFLCLKGFGNLGAAAVSVEQLKPTEEVRAADPEATLPTGDGTTDKVAVASPAAGIGAENPDPASEAVEQHTAEPMEDDPPTAGDGTTEEVTDPPPAAAGIGAENLGAAAVSVEQPTAEPMEEDGAADPEATPITGDGTTDEVEVPSAAAESGPKNPDPAVEAVEHPQAGGDPMEDVRAADPVVTQVATPITGDGTTDEVADPPPGSGKPDAAAEAIEQPPADGDKTMEEILAAEPEATQVTPPTGDNATEEVADPPSKSGAAEVPGPSGTAPQDMHFTKKKRPRSEEAAPVENKKRKAFVPDLGRKSGEVSVENKGTVSKKEPSTTLAFQKSKKEEDAERR